jgi:hypothetical protein
MTMSGIRNAMNLVAMAAGCMVIACSRAHEVPPELPEVASPLPPPPPPPAEPLVDTIELALLGSDGNELSELGTGQSFHARVDFRLDEDSPPVSRVTVQLGMYVDSGAFVTAWTKTVKPEQDSSGNWHVEAPLRAAPHAGTFHVRAETTQARYVLVEREVRIEEAQN